MCLSSAIFGSIVETQIQAVRSQPSRRHLLGGLHICSMVRQQWPLSLLMSSLAARVDSSLECLDGHPRSHARESGLAACPILGGGTVSGSQQACDSCGLHRRNVFGNPCGSLPMRELGCRIKMGNGGQIDPRLHIKLSVPAHDPGVDSLRALSSFRTTQITSIKCVSPFEPSSESAEHCG